MPPCRPNHQPPHPANECTHLPQKADSAPQRTLRLRCDHGLPFVAEQRAMVAADNLPKHTCKQEKCETTAEISSNFRQQDRHPTKFGRDVSRAVFFNRHNARMSRVSSGRAFNEHGGTVHGSTLCLLFPLCSLFRCLLSASWSWTLRSVSRSVTHNFGRPGLVSNSFRPSEKGLNPPIAKTVPLGQAAFGGWNVGSRCSAVQVERLANEWWHQAPIVGFWPE